MAKKIKVGDVVNLLHDVEMKQVILRAGSWGRVIEEDNGVFNVNWMLPRRFDSDRFGVFLEFRAQVVPGEVELAK